MGAGQHSKTWWSLRPRKQAEFLGKAEVLSNIGRNWNWGRKCELTGLTAACTSSPQARNDATPVLALLCTLHSLWHRYCSGFQVSAHQNALRDSSSVQPPKHTKSPSSAVIRVTEGTLHPRGKKKRPQRRRRTMRASAKRVTGSLSNFSRMFSAEALLGEHLCRED